jgi:stress-induced morphogen
MSRQSRIETALTDRFAPERLVVINESHLHAGHNHAAAITTRHLTEPAKPISASASSPKPFPA